MNKKEYSIEIGGKTLIAKFNDLANQTNGSVMVRYGNTVVLATAVMGKEPKDGDFFPLTVDYEERFYATGKILGSRFVRREGRPSTEAILSGRIVDRTIRPLFNQKMRHEIQVILTILSIDQDDPDVVSVIAASLALGVSDIPWNGPVSAVRICKNGTWLVNPDFKAREEAGISLEMVACGKDGLINMIEVGGREVGEEDLNEALNKSSEEIEKIEKWQIAIVKEMGKTKVEVEIPQPTPGTKELFEQEISPVLSDYVFHAGGKEKTVEVAEKWLNIFKEKIPEGNIGKALEILDESINELIHNEAIDNGKRADGRKMDEIRPLFAKAGGISPILHGSGIFYRGGTHIFSALTLGSPGDALVVDGVISQESKRFIHHYNFPPFSTGETGRIGGTNRRMIGHGALAEKALAPVIPPKDKFPYTIRIVSEAFASNGSTSMGSVCGSSLALMDGGVPIKAPVAGIASGLMMRNSKKYAILTDIQGPEDHHGDMDFKVAGTRAGITAVQMDIKIGGIPLDILAEALQKAKTARHKILDVIEKELDRPRPKISPSAPEIIVMKIKPDQIGLVIGSGGKTINEIRDVTHVEDITIEDDGSIFITGKNETAEKAKEIIFNMTREYMPGERYDGEVVRLMDFGAFIKIGPNAEGLVHVSEIAPFRVERVETYLKEGDKVPVIIKEIDDKGRINLSIKTADPQFFSKKEERPRLKKDIPKRF
ncbi:MAG: polyribonucleotide nucleotidyltransferase [Candidatus Taylorbacteria bacterium RIFCSPLOWO2_01_FULL_44_26]|uniref:Polyribonucleotide nucleotidyltransferase n=2 Tax=Candidatus Tayloriibacteriota TaxID=1817919 RepID=A0A1G2MLM0_9BACT|nr:MAG: polyribonucleotide nucleotidyltransferase [Candidatus Taylorbacteria bacterium RIFCSPHIGHO2_02_FULL_44_12]OHA31161.1 MAG: polyribonucleotide nucleotidyltransferase [Candidatus Taylorbacteria bacterium RIFCSPLOWO2_01_FULL_44_26]